MNEKRLKQFAEIVFLIAIIIAGGVIIYIGHQYNTQVSSIPQNTMQVLSNGWQYQNEETGDTREDVESLPTTIQLNDEEEELTLYYLLPEDLPRNPCIEFISRQTSVEVFLDGQPIYSYGVDTTPTFGKLLGNVRNEVLLPSDAENKELSIRLTSPYASDEYRISTITLGSRAELLHRFIQRNKGLLIFCAFSGFICLLILFVVIFFRIKKAPINGRSLISFMMFVFLACIWIMTDSNILQLLVTDFSLVYFISHVTFMLLPVPLMLFMAQSSSYGSRSYNILSIMYLAGFFLRMGLFLTGIVPLEKSLYLTHIMMGIGVVYCCAMLVQEWRTRRDKARLTFLVGFAALSICLLVSLWVFFYRGEQNYSILFIVMLTLMMVTMLYKFISRMQAMVKEGIKAQVYHEMAYIDIMTRFFNRSAFDEHMQAIQANPDCDRLTLAVLDINRLKYANDTYGHKAGDDLIRCAADCIRDKFEKIGECYRIGGDEFVVVLKDFSDESLEKIFDELRLSVAEAGYENPEGLSISAGYASGATEGEDFAYRLFEKADQRMYVQKREFHQQFEKSPEIY